jgi:hypothetical protein
LELVRLKDPPQRVEKHGGIVWGPQVHVDGTDPVHIFSLIIRIWGREMPLRHVLLRGGCRGPVLAPEGVHCDSKETWMLVRLLNLDHVE